ncbi:hypothetical protein VCRA2116O29_230013 [Vibrio crassostreae]|uniref:hypothetical protein n=1 Tax=Vibrio crassostreae TaxID=246167 RepID=UPI0010DD249A|nr:hypothetical protein [Vibrio crassostreae]TCN90375.1 hypothetical protein EDB37_100526 [Vibrio crassostreae]CAK2439970.1 hypothetical protein VCRA2116O29_230013 [Vibrio crassostreae]CAK2549544.1 hypothetical protein VCRA2119O48_60161 [Vibrio crassostreae]CAK2862306.1 hypothetical protein VCRA2133E348_20159 [Vibrio crassostreae]CAK3417680.1 hypothetical protein VCRA213O314_30002 [Vibrio crassostreae]
MKNVVKALKKKLKEDDELTVLTGSETNKVVGGYSHKDHARNAAGARNDRGGHW